MNEAVLQVLLILAYLAIGLIAITFPIFAICVTFLPQERWESEKERKKRIEKLRAKISELTAELNGEQRDTGRVAQLKEQLGRYESELRGTELGVEYLTAKGAVGRPASYLVLALISVGIGLYFFNLESLEGVIVFGTISGLLSAMVVHRLYKTIAAVEYAALRPARTVEFKVDVHPIGKKSMVIKHGKETELEVTASTDEADVENFVIYIGIPSELAVTEMAVSEPLLHRYFIGEEYTTLILERSFLPREINVVNIFPVLPKKIGEYSIYVRICGKGVYTYKKELKLKVVK